MVEGSDASQGISSAASGASLAAHTAGPWKIIGPDEDGDRVISTVTYDTIAPVWAEGWGTVENPATQRANARLIAAAPDLLASLCEFMEDERFQVGVGGNPNAVEAMLRRARAAITKALHEPPSPEALSDKGTGE